MERNFRQQAPYRHRQEKATRLFLRILRNNFFIFRTISDHETISPLHGSGLLITIF